MSEERKSVDDYFDSFDQSEATKRLLDHVREHLERVRGSCSGLARFSGIPERRLRYILLEAQNPKLYRHEVKKLVLMTAIALDVVFGLPDFEGDWTDSQRYIDCMHKCLDTYEEAA